MRQLRIAPLGGGVDAGVCVRGFLVSRVIFAYFYRQFKIKNIPPHFTYRRFKVFLFLLLFHSFLEFSSKYCSAKMFT